jgi:hypothetical protein
MRADPTLALLVDLGLRTHYVPGTGSSYRTASRDYVRFCVKRGLQPWAVDPIVYCGWLHVTAARIQMSSLSMYMAGVRDTSILEGYGWHMTGNEMVRRTMRFLKRKYPAKVKGSKVPVTVGVLHRILPLLTGWPDMAVMSEDDRVFAVASVSAVCGFLRGGEFLASSKSTRAVLKARDVSIRVVGTRRAQVINVPQTKTRWWIESESVPCFENTVDDTMCPVRLWEEYTIRCPALTPGGPAFLLRGKALTRDYMVKRTTTLMCLANISFVDHKGVPMDVRAASWRSGAVCSAVKAGVSVPHIMALGRWSSSAWENYLLQSPMDLQGSANSMWASTSLPMAPATSGLRVVEFDVGGFFAPFISRSVNTDLSSLSIDINSPSKE